MTIIPTTEKGTGSLDPRVTIAENQFGVDAELIAKFALPRCRIKEIGITYNARTYAEGKKCPGKMPCARFT
jgi:hypothetical protein